MHAMYITMKNGCRNSYSLQEIDSIYIQTNTGGEWWKKERVYDYLKLYPTTIQVNIAPFPYLIPALSIKNEKYVKSNPNDTPNDNLLRLPRC